MLGKNGNNGNGKGNGKLRSIASIPTLYRDIRFRSKLEARWACWFDKIGIPWRHSLTCPTRKLTERQVREIFVLLQAGKRPREIAPLFSVARCTVASIKAGITWKRLMPKDFSPQYGAFGELSHSAKLTVANVRNIRALFGKLSGSKIAKQFGVSFPTIEAIKYGRTWKSVI